MFLYEPGGIVGAGHNGLRQRQQQLAVGGRLHPPAVAFEEGHAQLLLQAGDLPADGGLRQMHQAGSASEAAHLGHGEE